MFRPLQLTQVNAEIAPLHESTYAHLQAVQTQTSQLSQSRFKLMDDLGRLHSSLVSSEGGERGQEVEADKTTLSLLEQMEAAKQRLEVLGMGIKWMGVLEKVMICA